MEKQVKQRNKILAFLPKAASSAVTLQVSPTGKGLAAPVVSLIPKEAPRKSKNGSFDAREPTSPKVSCMGQVKCKKKKKQRQIMGKPRLASRPPPPPSPPPQTFPEEVKIRKRWMMLKAFKGTRLGHKSDDVPNAGADIAERVPSIRRMKHFSSARGALSDFDWRTYDAGGATGCVSNPLYEEKRVKSEKEEKVAVVNGVIEIVEDGTRKENLWNRRTTARLTPISVATA